jgi:hypothetical protein
MKLKSSTWHVDETSVGVAVQRRYLFRAVDNPDRPLVPTTLAVIFLVALNSREVFDLKPTSGNPGILSGARTYIILSRELGPLGTLPTQSRKAAVS